MCYKEKLESLISELNSILGDYLLFPKQNRGRFSLKIQDDLIFEKDNFGIVVDLYFTEENLIHHILQRKMSSKNKDDLNKIFGMFYLEVLRIAFLAKDSVNELKDNFGTPINTLNFHTIMSEGLKKLKQ